VQDLAQQAVVAGNEFFAVMQVADKHGYLPDPDKPELQAHVDKTADLSKHTIAYLQRENKKTFNRA
jgi:hypothetical protein